ncbi:MAG: response regulator, partial [Chloroflexi bacterium]|nr:response regulator [Chloroflexota bacterium]
MTMVLVVEDEPRIRDVLVDTLLDAGFDVVDVADGTDAIQMMAERVPDIVLLDVMMPGLDGFQVMEHMKKNPGTESIPVVLLTALPADQGEIAARKMGVTHYISKPWDPGMVEATIRITLQETKALLNAKIDPAPEEQAQVINMNTDNVNQVAMEGQLARFKSGRKKDQAANSNEDEIPSIKTAEKLAALEQRMGGGLPLSSVTLAVGAASSGKSTLCQHFVYGALDGGYGVAYFTSEQTQDSLLTQMKTIGLDVNQYHQKEKLRIYAVPEQSEGEKAEVLIGQLAQSMERLSRGTQF